MVPDVAEEIERIGHARRPGPVRARQLARPRAAPARRRCGRGRPWPTPAAGSTTGVAEVGLLRDRARRTLRHQLDRAHDDLGHQLARVRGLSPLATLRRGYAVVQDADGHVVTSPEQTSVDDRLLVRVAAGRLGVVVQKTALDPTDDSTAGPRRRPRHRPLGADR